MTLSKVEDDCLYFRSTTTWNIPLKDESKFSHIYSNGGLFYKLVTPVTISITQWVISVNRMRGWNECFFCDNDVDGVNNQ